MSCLAVTLTTRKINSQRPSFPYCETLPETKSLSCKQETNGKKDRDVRNERTNPVSKTKDPKEERNNAPKRKKQNEDKIKK